MAYILQSPAQAPHITISRPLTQSFSSLIVPGNNLASDRKWKSIWWPDRVQEWLCCGRGGMPELFLWSYFTEFGRIWDLGVSLRSCRSPKEEKPKSFCQKQKLQSTLSIFIHRSAKHSFSQFIRDAISVLKWKSIGGLRSKEASIFWKQTNPVFCWTQNLAQYRLIRTIRNLKFTRADYCF